MGAIIERSLNLPVTVLLKMLYRWRKGLVFWLGRFSERILDRGMTWCPKLHWKHRRARVSQLWCSVAWAGRAGRPYAT